MPSLASLGFDGAPDLLDRPPASEAEAQTAAKRWVRSEIRGYGTGRNVLADDTSRLSVHLRFGTLSPRWLEERVLAAGGRGAEVLPLRARLARLLRRGPAAPPGGGADGAPGALPGHAGWDDDPDALAAWKAGETGYPVVDAAMRQLRVTGWMHNRARMIVASFLVKDLHLDWRLGEAHFMEHLLDGDVGSNNGGWQWVASTGTDPAPYFQRLFNPIAASRSASTPTDATSGAGFLSSPTSPTRSWVNRGRCPMTNSGEAGCIIGKRLPRPDRRPRRGTAGRDGALPRRVTRRRQYIPRP